MTRYRRYYDGSRANTGRKVHATYTLGTSTRRSLCNVPIRTSVIDDTEITCRQCLGNIERATKDTDWVRVYGAGGAEPTTDLSGNPSRVLEEMTEKACAKLGLEVDHDSFHAWADWLDEPVPGSAAADKISGTGRPPWMEILEEAGGDPEVAEAAVRKALGELRVEDPSPMEAALEGILDAARAILDPDDGRGVLAPYVPPSEYRRALLLIERTAESALPPKTRPGVDAAAEQHGGPTKEER
jgi:hypothetical protein